MLFHKWQKYGFDKFLPQMHIYMCSLIAVVATCVLRAGEKTDRSNVDIATRFNGDMDAGDVAEFLLISGTFAHAMYHFRREFTQIVELKLMYLVKTRDTD